MRLASSLDLEIEAASLDLQMEAAAHRLRARFKAPHAPGQRVGAPTRGVHLGPKRMGTQHAARSTQHAADVGAPGVSWRAAPETARAAAGRLSTEETASRVEEGTP